MSAPEPSAASFVGDHPQLSRAEQSIAVAGAVAGAIKRCTGHGPRNVRSGWIGTDTLVVLLENRETEMERVLLAADRGDDVLRVRRLTLAAAERELAGAVAAALGRSVETVVSGTRLSPDLTSLVFALGPTDDPHPACGARERRP